MIHPAICGVDERSSLAPIPPFLRQSRGKAPLVLAAAVYAAIAAVVFDQGLKHDASGNRMTVDR